MIAELDGLLRAEGRYAIGRARVPVKHLALLLAVCGFLYGAGMGFYGHRPRQALYSGLKVPLLLAVSTGICLPSFFVLNTLLGLRDDFASAMRAVLAAQATVGVALLSLLPVILFVYTSDCGYERAVLFNGLFFALATLAGQRTLSRHYAPLIRKDSRHVHCRRAWVVLYVFVVIQMAWVLRPFVGYAGLDVSFFRPGAWSNAYVVVLRDVLGFQF